MVSRVAERYRHMKRAAERPQRVGCVFLVGAGPGDPGLITLRGVDCLREADVVIGADCEIMAGAVIRRYTEMGPGNVVHPHAVLGGLPSVVLGFLGILLAVPVAATLKIFTLSAIAGYKESSYYKNNES